MALRATPQDGISSYAYQAQMTGGMNYGLSSGIWRKHQWQYEPYLETARQFDIGVDLSLLKR